MHTVTPDVIVLIATAVFLVGFVAIAFWLLQR
jgi:hypothetical protein